MPFKQIFHITRIFNCALILCALVFLADVAIAQDHIGFPLRAQLAQTNSSKEINLAARGESEQIVRAVEQLGGKVVRAFPDLVTFRIPAGRVSDLAANDAVTTLEFNYGSGQPLNDSMLVLNRIVPVHLGLNGPGSALTGKDVVVGLVDTGIELAHPDFQNADGTTRIKYLWDMNQTGTPPEPYGYGVEWTAADIDAGLTGHQDQAQYFGHGSTVTGTLTGNGLAIEDFKGAAPESDMIIVSSDFGVPNWNLTVADAVEYIFQKADEMGKPAVVNLSLGNYVGSHDGLDAAALIIDSLLSEQPGRVVVCAAGNSGNWPAYHLGYEVNSDTAFTWFNYNSNSGLGYGAVFFELWADTLDLQGVQFAVGADKVSPYFHFRGHTAFRSVQETVGITVTDTLKNGGNTIAIVDYFAQLRGGQYNLQVHLQEPDSSQYRYRFITTGSGKFDCWSTSILGTSNMVASGLPDSAAFPDIVNYRVPDKRKHTVSSWTCSPKVITVGNYNNRDQYIDYNGNLQTFNPPAGQLSVNSSHGPTRDERLKPEVSATGDLTLSSGKFSVLNALIANEPFKVAQGGMHYRNGGTSMASPVVSGVVALLLEQCPQATFETIREAILQNTYQDAFTGDTISNAYGNGKVDAMAAIQSVLFEPQFVQPLTSVLCEGESITLELNGDYNEYAWSNGSNANVLVVDTAGQYSVEVMAPNGCRGRSDTLTVELQPLPDVQIAQQMDTLWSDVQEGWSYQWLINENPIPGANQFYYVPSESGIYSLQVTDSLGCEAVSNSIDLVVTGISTFSTGSIWRVFPIPADDNIVLTGPGGAQEIVISTTAGKVVREFNVSTRQMNQYQLDLSELPRGIYLIRVVSASETETIRFILR